MTQAQRLDIGDAPNFYRLQIADRAEGETDGRLQPIPKAVWKGVQFAGGVPALKRVTESETVAVLNCIYEEEFLGFSYLSTQRPSNEGGAGWQCAAGRLITLNIPMTVAGVPIPTKAPVCNRVNSAWAPPRSEPAKNHDLLPSTRTRMSRWPCGEEQTRSNNLLAAQVDRISDLMPGPRAGRPPSSAPAALSATAPACQRRQMGNSSSEPGPTRQIPVKGGYPCRACSKIGRQ